MKPNQSRGPIDTEQKYDILSCNGLADICGVQVSALLRKG